MADHPLLFRVADWPGRGPTQLAFEARGFTIHKAWQDRVIEFCGERSLQVLNHYWDEVALETMQSLGQGAPDQRAFVIQPKYRSTFLDELFVARDFVESAFRYPPLVKCLFERAKKTNLDAKFRECESAFFHDLRRVESKRLSIQAIGWSGKKRDAIPFVDEFCRLLGFERHRTRWRRKVGADLVFEVGVDLGGNPFCTTPPLTFRIFHVGDPKFEFDIVGAAVLGRLVPGFGTYAACKDAIDYVLGIKAHVELFDVVRVSFEKKTA